MFVFIQIRFDYNTNAYCVQIETNNNIFVCYRGAYLTLCENTKINNEIILILI